MKKPFFCILLLFATKTSILADTIALSESDWQPFTAQIRRLTEALESVGSPLDEKTQASLKEALVEKNITNAIQKIQSALDAHCLFAVIIIPEMSVKVDPGPPKPELAEQDCRNFLVKVENDSGPTAPLQAVSPNAVSGLAGPG